jgi:hypothetical protein
VRRLLASRLAQAGVVVVLLAALFLAAGQAGHPVAFGSGTQPRSAAAATVTAATRACADPGSGGPGAGGLAIATAPAGDGAGQAEVSRLSPAGNRAPGARLRSLSQPGQLTIMKVSRGPAPARKAAQASKSRIVTGPGRGGVMVQATGAMAQGLEVEQAGAGGLVTARCAEPGTDFWFVGPGGRSLADLQLFLMNTDGQPASAQVDVLSQGATPLGSDAGISVPAHGIVVQSLTRLLKGAAVAALHVHASSGRVVAAVRESGKAGKPGGWLPPSAPPATRQVLPGLPGAAGTRELYLAVPGGSDAQVKLTAITGKGSYQPTGGSSINLPGGGAIGIKLPSMSGVPAALQISANVPVAAAMLASGGAAGAPGAFTAASGPVQQQGVIADTLASGSASTSLVLSAPHAAASVHVVFITSRSGTGQAGQLVRVPAGRSVLVPVRLPRGTSRGSPVAILLTPAAGSGPVYAARVLTSRGIVQSILPVPSAPTSIPLPLTQNSLATVLP